MCYCDSYRVHKVTYSVIDISHVIHTDGQTDSTHQNLTEIPTMNSITDKFERYHFQEQSEGSIQFKIQYSERVYWRRNPITRRLTSHRTARATARLLPFNPFGSSRSRSSHSSDRLYFKGYWLLFPSVWSHCPVRNIANRLSIWHTYIHTSTELLQMVKLLASILQVPCSNLDRGMEYHERFFVVYRSPSGQMARKHLEPIFSYI
jgi:hypothetical protein